MSFGDELGNRIIPTSTHNTKGVLIMTSKTPFEIRTDLLSQAYAICTEKMYAERQRLENDWNMRRDEWSIKAANGNYTEAPLFPSLPAITTEDVVDEARKLNDFVSNG